LKNNFVKGFHENEKRKRMKRKEFQDEDDDQDDDKDDGEQSTLLYTCLKWGKSKKGMKKMSIRETLY
jgi:hypothetical protein